MGDVLEEEEEVEVVGVEDVGLEVEEDNYKGEAEVGSLYDCHRAR